MENNKTISKAKLDAAIKSARHWHDLSVPFEEKDIEAYHDVCHSVRVVAGFGSYSFPCLFSALFGFQGLKDDATNEDVYKVLEVLGWSVVEGDIHE